MEQLVRGVDTEKIARAVRMILEAIGEDPERDGLRETPRRVAEAYAELCSQVGRDPGAELKTFFETAHDDLVIVRDIPFYSLCEHHLAPFFGLAHIGYIPQDGVVTGLSKLARCVESAARRPQIQEIMTGQIADAIMDRLAPQGVIVVLEAEHLCMTMRGVKKPGSKTITSAVRGVFRDDPKARAEALALIRPER